VNLKTGERGVHAPPPKFCSVLLNLDHDSLHKADAIFIKVGRHCLAKGTAVFAEDDVGSKGPWG